MEQEQPLFRMVIVTRETTCGTCEKDKAYTSSKVEQGTKDYGAWEESTDRGSLFIPMDLFTKVTSLDLFLPCC